MKINLMKNVICLLLCITHVWLNANIACMPSGVSYQAIIRDNPAQKIHLVRIDPKRAAIMVDPAEGKCIGAETTTEIAQRSGAVVAMNGSYFDFVASSRFAKLCIKALDAIGYRNYKMVPVYAL